MQTSHEASATVEICEHCGEELVAEVLEVWGRDFMLNACCEWTEALLREEVLEGERKAARGLFAEAGLAVRQLYSEDGSQRLDFGLEPCAVTLKEAKAFVGEHHRHTRPPCSWRWGHGLRNGRDLIAVAMVGRPVARKIDHTKVVEVNRLCVNPDIAPELVWNACSQLYGLAAREAKRRGFEMIITYTLESEPGTALRAAGWERVAVTRGGTWNRPSRPREDKAPTCRKVRWERKL